MRLDEETAVEVTEILNRFGLSLASGAVTVTQLKHEEDDALYRVWRVDTESDRYILKEAKAYEPEIYQHLLAHTEKHAPAVYQTAEADGKTFLLMEYIQGENLCKCSRRKLALALDALIALQKETWESADCANVGYSFNESLPERNERGKYLNDPVLEQVYARFLAIYASVPRTLCHDDLLPFNILVSETTAVLIDWEYGGMLPYPTSFARLIAHGGEREDSLFCITPEDKAFAIEYYYENLLKENGISYTQWHNTLEYFLFYEYCEWVFLGNKYKNYDNIYYTEYFRLAKEQAQKILDLERR